MDRQDITSLTLLQKIRTGDPVAWERTVALYRPLILYWCRRGGAGEDAEDLAQEVLLAAAIRIAEFRRDRPGDSFRGWLRGVTRNKLLERNRRRSHQIGEGAGGTDAGIDLEARSVELDSTDPADEVAERIEVRSLYLRALDLVRDEVESKTWRAFWRVAADGVATSDVAVEMGVSAASIRQAKSRVLRRLKEVVGDLID